MLRKKEVLSLNFPSRLYYKPKDRESIAFASASHFFYWCKARFFEEEAIMKRIEEEDLSPLQCERLCSNLSSEEWSEVEESFLDLSNLLKFSQNEELIEILSEEDKKRLSLN